MKELIIIILIGFGLQSTNHINIVDYRDGYVGTYACKQSSKYLDDTHQTKYLVQTKNVTVSKSSIDSMLILNTNEGQFEVKVLNNQFKHLRRNFSGKFSNDSIFFRFIPSLGPSAFTYVGKK
jgi:hypothetical protein